MILKKNYFFLEEDTKNQVCVKSYRMVELRENNLLKTDKFYSAQQALKWFIDKLQRDQSILDSSGRKIVGFIMGEKSGNNILIVTYVTL